MNLRHWATLYCCLLAAPAPAVCPCEVLDDAGRLVRNEAISIPRIALLDGKPADLDSGSSRFVAVLFWATWCPHCAIVFRQPDLLDRAFRSRGVNWVAVSVDYDSDALRNFASRDAPELPIAAISFDIAAAFKRVRAVPYLVVIDRSTGLVAAVDHPQTPAAIQSILDDLIAR